MAPADITIAAKIEKPVLDRLRDAARKDDRSLSGQIRRVLRAWADAEGSHASNHNENETAAER